MRPIRLLDGTPWDARDSNRMLQFFNQQASDELRARDIARGLPKSGACGKWIGRGNDKVFVVDPLLSRLKHSGEEHGKLRLAKWEAFCAEPRDPLVELAKIGEVPAPDESPRTHIQGLFPAIQEAIAQGVAAAVAAALSNGHNAGAKSLTPPTRRAARKLEPVVVEDST